MQDSVAFFTYNDQGGPRGGQDFNVQNWWMGMAQRPAVGGTLQFNLMLSLEPATLGKDGYREIFPGGRDVERSSIDRPTASARIPDARRHRRLGKLELDQESRGKILGENAGRLLGLSANPA